MRDKENINQKVGQNEHFILQSVQDLPIPEGSSVKVKINEKWYRGRYQIDINGENSEAVLFVGDKNFVIPTGSEIELINRPR